MKKKLIFVIESLTLGGAEKSLVTLLNLLDYSKYDVDLILFAQGGAFQSLLPKEVNLLPVPDYFAYNAIPWSKADRKLKEPGKMLAQLRYSIALRTGKHNHIEKAVLLWQASHKCFDMVPKEYDVAIAYAQGVPTFFVAEKVKATKKAAWINATYIPKGKYLDYIRPIYKKFDFVNGVSSTVVAQIQSVLKVPSNKTLQMTDILDVDFAHKMALMDSHAEKDMATDEIKILTVGRFCVMKRYDLAVDAARILADRGIHFTWYAIGDGELRAEIENLIEAKKLKDKFILLGSRSNPYPYFKACDLYVQTSDFEGFGITLAEAKMFQKPIVTTNFNAVGAQFINEKNGLIVDISAPAIADGIIRMLTDTQLRETCIANLRKEKIGNTEEIEKFYRMVES